MGDKGKGGPQAGGDGKVPVTIRLPVDLVDEIDRLAEEELRSRSAQIQKMLEESDPKQPAPAGKR